MNKGIKIVGSLVIIALAVWLVVSNSKNSSNETMKIGVISILSGPFADYGEEIRKGVLAATSSTPGIEFVFEDDKCEPKDAVSAFRKLVDFDKIDVIIGPGCGSPQEAVVPLAKESGTIILVPSAASRDLYIQSGGNFFNVQYSLEDESTFIGNKLNELGYKKVALVSYRNAFSETHVKAFRAAFKGEIIDHILTENTSDVSPEIAKIKNENPDAVYSPDVSFFFASGLVKLRQYGVMAPVYGTYVVELPAVRTLVPDVFYSFPGDLTGSQGAVYELSKQAAEIAGKALVSCKGSADCVRKNLVSSGDFDEYGVYTRPLILKQVKGSEVITL